MRCRLGLQDVSTDIDCTVCRCNWVADKAQILVSYKPATELDSRQGDSCEVDIFIPLHVVMAAIVRKHVDQLEHLAHPQAVHVEHLVLLAQLFVLAYREIQLEPGSEWAAARHTA